MKCIYFYNGSIEFEERKFFWPTVYVNDTFNVELIMLLAHLR